MGGAQGARRRRGAGGRRPPATAGVLAALLLRTATSLSAEEIPTTHTPREGSACGVPEVEGELYPALALSECDEALCEGCTDLRGFWSGTVDGDHHEERVEQCGTRVILAGPLDAGAHVFSHDFGVADGSYANGADDYDALALPTCEAAEYRGEFAWDCFVTARPGDAEPATRCLRPDGTVEYSDPAAFAGAVVLTRTAPLDYLRSDEPLPFSISRKDGLVGSGDARKYLLLFLLLTGLALVVSWSLAYLVATHPALGEGEPTVIYLC